MNTDIFKKAFCLVLYLFLIMAFSIPAFARFEGDIEVVARIEAESSEICSSDIPESSDTSESIISSDKTDSEAVKTGDSSTIWIIVLTISISMVVVIISFSKRNKKLN